jgi:acetyltransferase-like isoleucine patch superfamily enzyme
MIADPILIGSNVWIGRGCAVLPGVNIGDGAVVGANSVVNRNIAAMVVAVGAPARTIRSRTKA